MYLKYYVIFQNRNITHNCSNFKIGTDVLAGTSVFLKDIAIIYTFNLITWKFSLCLPLLILKIELLVTKYYSVICLKALFQMVPTAGERCEEIVRKCL